MKTTVTVPLGAFSRGGVESCFGPDLAAGAQAAISDYVSRIESGVRPIGLPRFDMGIGGSGAVSILNLPIDGRTAAVLEREAARQGSTVGEVAAHSVLLYLAELDRLTPPGSSRAA